MADELDAELLGMVGGSDDESGDDYDSPDQTQVIEDRSPSAEPHESVEKVDEPERKKGVAQKVKGRRGKRKARRDSEDENDAASPSPSDSMGGPVIDDHDGEADAPAEHDDEDAPLYPLEGKFTSAADRDYVLSLGELKREEILAERAQEVIKRQQDLQLRKALASNNATNKAKRKAAAADFEDSNRRSTRPRVEKRTALDDYREARERKGAERDRVALARDRKDERSPSPRGSEADADGESEVEWAEPERKDEPPAEIRDFDRCRVGRSNFAKVCFYPGFEDAIRGCFARVSIGVNRETGQNTYRMTQIKDFTDGKPYQLENASGKKIMTDQYAIVVQGSSEKIWPFSACSDGRFTEAEFTRFTDTLKKENLRVPPKKSLSRKVDDINKLLDTKFTEETLQLKFAKQRAIQLKYDPVHQAKIKRKDIERRRAQALANNDEEEVAKCDSAMEALNNAASNGVSAVKMKQSPPKPQTQHERLALLNHSNRAKNQQEVRQALIEERKKILKAREAEAARKTAEVRARVHANAAARRKSNMELFGEGTPNGSRAGTPLNGTPKRRPATPEVHQGPVGALKKKAMDDEVVGSLDLGIDIEI